MVTRRTKALIGAGAATVLIAAGAVVVTQFAGDDSAPTAAAPHPGVTVSNPDATTARELTQEELDFALSDAPEGEVAEDDQVEITWYEEPTGPPEPDPAYRDVTAGTVLDHDPGPLPGTLAAAPVGEEEWLVVDSTEPLPEQVTDRITQDAAELPTLSNEPTREERGHVAAAHEEFAQNLFDHTGRWPVLIHPRHTGDDGVEEWQVWVMVDDHRYTSSYTDLESAHAQVPVIVEDLGHPDDFHPPMVLGAP